MSYELNGIIVTAPFGEARSVQDRAECGGVLRDQLRCAPRVRHSRDWWASGPGPGGRTPPGLSRVSAGF